MRRWRICLDCGTEWLADEVATGGACGDCGGPTTPMERRPSMNETSTFGLPEEKRNRVEALMRDIADNARETLLADGDELFYEKSREFAAGVARGILALGYRRDYHELLALVDELFSR